MYYTGDMGARLRDGCLVHQGRKDFQVKIRGYRVETSEIEMALLQIGTLKEVVVASQHDKRGELRLVAYVVPFHLPGPSSKDLRNMLSNTLPDYMIPSGFTQLPKLPRAPNGKLYRRGLPEYPFDRPRVSSHYAPASTIIEESLTKIWEGVLGIGHVGIDDVFLDLGGHSLQAMRIASRISATWSINCTMAHLLNTPTIRELACIVEDLVMESEP